ncbi:ankyrin repeat-containing protein At2g01680-like isoform X2 [Actinidia eriantha]|uniref:ankyrin repeat-containing protein At2g01680-like isoform X2 n=1 Tax=Actinidia eriantha TaxID=165200 RepID=UPI002587E162|nr:ankyrin repeat-containing protein At2g01680-like isoform X2 [Actinidia eriantha]
MDPSLYKAAMKGNIGVLMQNKDRFEEQVTPTNNTVLHVTAQFHNSPYIAREILETQSSLLLRVNSGGETALHIAARKGHSNTVKALIAFAKTLGTDQESGVKVIEQMVRTASENNDTALHEAVRNNHLGVVNLLVEEDKEFPHGANNSGETPLYLAAERNYHEIVSIILATCTSPAFNGPNGRTALHAAVFSGCPASVRELLRWRPSLTKEGDEYGWTPLHCAARLNDVELMRKLLDADKDIAYQIAEEDGKKTALHLAALHGNVEAMEVLLSHCPDCWEMVNDRGQNILHIAIGYDKVNAVQCILKSPWVDNLLNQKDNEGNTPWHLLAVSDYRMDELDKLLPLICHPLADMCAFNNENLTPLDKALSFDSSGVIYEVLEFFGEPGRRNIPHDDTAMFLKNRAEKKKGKPMTDIEWKAMLLKRCVRNKKQIQMPSAVSKFAKNNMIVAALIATVTFAAGFTLPGGYNGNAGPNQGMAVLVRKAAFKAFVISNAMAVICSTSSLFAFFVGSFYENPKKLVFPYKTGLYLKLISLVAMIIAFITGTYAVLATTPGLGVAIAVCVMGCSFFVIYFVFLHKLFRGDWLG